MDFSMKHPLHLSGKLLASRITSGEHAWFY
jgi:hypothetical protein